MTQVTLGSEQQQKKNSPARFGKRSVFILDPRLTINIFSNQ